MDVRRGEVKSFDSGAHTATVQVAGSLSVWLSGRAEHRIWRDGGGQELRDSSLDDTNPQDAVVIAVYT